MASQEKREFDKYLKFLTSKAVQIIVQSRQGRKIVTKSNPRGNDWFNLSIPDDKQVSSELKRSLEGRLPEPGQPVSVEILMDTAEGDSIILEVWSVDLDHSKRDVSVSVAHVLYPRLSLMLRSLAVFSRTTPAYRLSRRHEEDLKFTFRVYTAVPDFNTKGFKNVLCARTSCPYGTVSLSLLYRDTITLPDRPIVESTISECLMPEQTADHQCSESSISPSLPHLPFTPQSSHSDGCGLHQPDPVPFSTILSHRMEDLQREESHDTLTSSEGGRIEGEMDFASLPVADHEQDGYVMVNLTDIKPTFATHTNLDDVGKFLQLCRDIPTLDLLSGENSMDVEAAMRLIDEKTEGGSRPSNTSAVDVS